MTIRARFRRHYIRDKDLHDLPRQRTLGPLWQWYGRWWLLIEREPYIRCYAVLPVRVETVPLWIVWWMWLVLKYRVLFLVIGWLERCGFYAFQECEQWRWWYVLTRLQWPCRRGRL